MARALNISRGEVAQLERGFSFPTEALRRRIEALEKAAPANLLPGPTP